MAEAGSSAGILEPEPMNLSRVLRAAIPFLLMGVVFAGAFHRVWHRWTAEEDYYSHGPLIPFVTAYLVLRKRRELTGEAPPETGVLYAGGIGAGILYFIFKSYKKELAGHGIGTEHLFVILAGASALYLVYCLRRLKPEPWKPGLLVFVPGLLFCTVASVFEIVSVAWFFVLVTVIGLVLYYLGKRVARVIAFPLLFLFTTVPMPEYIIQRVTLPLKSFATANTVRALQSSVLRITCEQRGASKIVLVGADGKGRDLTVGAPCSGLRSLIALISFGLLFAYITPLSMGKKAVLFLASIPASFIANWFRIMALALVTYWWDAKVAVEDGLWVRLESTWLSSVVPNLKTLSEKEPVHDFIGIMVFVVAFIGLFALERLLTRMQQRQDARKRGLAGSELALETADV